MEMCDGDEEGRENSNLSTETRATILPFHHVELHESAYFFKIMNHIYIQHSYPICFFYPFIFLVLHILTILPPFILPYPLTHSLINPEGKPMPTTIQSKQHKRDPLHLERQPRPILPISPPLFNLKRWPSQCHLSSHG